MRSRRASVGTAIAGTNTAPGLRRNLDLLDGTRRRSDRVAILARYLKMTFDGLANLTLHFLDAHTGGNASWKVRDACREVCFGVFKHDRVALCNLGEWDKNLDGLKRHRDSTVPGPFDQAKLFQSRMLGGKGSDNAQTTISTIEPSSRTSLARARRAAGIYCKLAIYARPAHTHAAPRRPG